MLTKTAMGVATKKLTWEDIRDLPESAGRTEIVDGELVVSPTPARRHQRICTLLGMHISRFVEERRLGEFFSSAIHVILAEHVHYEPDLCFVSKERLSIIEENYIDGPPDLIIEVILESNCTHGTVVKFNDYQRYGVREYWLVDPRESQIRVFVLHGDEYSAAGILSLGEPVVSRILQGLQLNPADVLEKPPAH